MFFNRIIKAITLVVITAATHHSYAQIDNAYLSDNYNIDSGATQHIGFQLNNFNYLRNTEYFNDIELGRTLFGYQLSPTVYFQANPHVRLTTGVWVRNDFGGRKFISQAFPIFTLSYRKHHTQINFGTLEGALSHRLIEPLFDINAAIERRIENGFQLKRQTRKSDLDLWINWEQFIERGDPFKERFFVGLNYLPTLYSRPNQFSIKLPLQVTAFHRGGQIDTDTSNMLMQFNGAAGLQLCFQPRNSWITQWTVDGYYTYYNENSNSGYYPFRSGNGYFINASATVKNFTAMLSYWDASNWIATRGTHIYSSVSVDKPGFVANKRTLAIMRLFYQVKLTDQLKMVARVEPIYDVKTSAVDFSYSFYLSYKLDASLKVLKP